MAPLKTSGKGHQGHCYPHVNMSEVDVSHRPFSNNSFPRHALNRKSCLGDSTTDKNRARSFLVKPSRRRRHLRCSLKKPYNSSAASLRDRVLSLAEFGFDGVLKRKITTLPKESLEPRFIYPSVQCRT